MRLLQKALTVLTLSIGPVIAGESCSSSTTSPTTPRVPAPTGPTQSAACLESEAISGVVTAHRGGPVGGMHVQLVPYPFGFSADTETDSQGHYSACSPSRGRVAIQIWSPHQPAYATAFRYDVGPGERADFVVHPRFLAPTDGGTVSGTISGDEFIAGDDEFGGRCQDTPCKVVDFRGSWPAAVEISLGWNDISRDLALYISHEDYLPSHPALGDRYCCRSEVVAPYFFNYDFDRFAIGFEHVAGGKPSPADSQDFELTIRPLR